MRKTLLIILGIITCTTALAAVYVKRFPSDTPVSVPATGDSNLVPAGGTTNQVLSKNSNTDYDLKWAAAGGGGGGAFTTIGDVTSGTNAFDGTAGTTLTFLNATSGSIAVTPVSGALGTRTLSLPAATDTLVGKATTDTLTNKTLTAPVISSIVNTGTLTLPTQTTTLVGLITTDTLTNKTLTAPVIASIVNTGTLTLPTITDTIVGRATTDTLTNKTLTSPVISTIVNTGTLTLPTITTTLVGLSTTDTLTNKTLTAPVMSSIVNTGTLTLPTQTTTLVGLITTDTLTNKTLTSPVISTIVNTGTLTLPTITDTLVGRATTDTLTNKTLTSPTLTTPALGAATYTTLSGGAITDSALTITRVPFASTSGLIIDDAGFTFTTATDQLLLGENGQSGSLKIYSEDGGTDHSTIFQPGTQTQDITYTLPVNDGDANQVLQTNGAGVLSWVAAGSGSGDITDVGDTTSGAAFNAVNTGTTLTFSNATSGTIALTPVSGALGTKTLSLPAATDTLVGKATTDVLTNKTLTLTAGTTSVAPLTLASGTNLTTATAGSEEYDGLVFYKTPVASARGVSPSVMYTILSSSNFTLQTGAGVQSAFESTGDVFTLAANTTYYFEGTYFLTKTGSVTEAMAFASGGGGSLTSIGYWVHAGNSAANSVLSSSNCLTFVTQASTTVVTLSSSGSTTMHFAGLIRTNAAGTLTPQINFSGTVTSPTMNANSYMRMYALGTDTNNTVGNVG